MPEIFREFTITFFTLATLIIFGMIFEEQFLILEDKFDEWWEGVRKTVESRKKLKTLVNENKALREENEKLMDDNERLSDSNLDVYWENKLLNVKLQKKEGQKFGEYFYETINKNAHSECKSE